MIWLVGFFWGRGYSGIYLSGLIWSGLVIFSQYLGIHCYENTVFQASCFLLVGV